MRNICVAACVVVVLAGCGGAAVGVDPTPDQDALESLNESLSEALSAVRALSQPAESEDADSDAAPLPAVMADVVAAAWSFVAASAGTSMEADSKTIFAAAEALEKKARSTPTDAAIVTGLNDLRSKVSALRSRQPTAR